jgi:hypothetical protein
LKAAGTVPYLPRDTVRRIALLTVILPLVGGVLAPDASAHRLSTARAKQAISFEIGFVFEDYHRAVETIGRCSRRSPHAVSCSLQVAFEVRPDTGPTGTCTGRLTAVLYNRRGRVRTNYASARNRTFRCTPPGPP